MLATAPPYPTRGGDCSGTPLRVVRGTSRSSPGRAAVLRPLSGAGRGVASELGRGPASGGDWNRSRHDPWWRDWLTSRELFDWYHDFFPRLGERLHGMLDGEVFEYKCDGNHPIQAWISTSEVIVAYVPFDERHVVGTRGGLEEFAGWVDHLRCSEPMALGRVRGRSSYGAIRTDCSTTALRGQMGSGGRLGRCAALATEGGPA